MGKLLRALVVTSAATAAALVVAAALRKASVDDEAPDPRKTSLSETSEVDADALPETMRQDLVTELEGHVSP